MPAMSTSWHMGRDRQDGSDSVHRRGDERLTVLSPRSSLTWRRVSQWRDVAPVGPPDAFFDRPRRAQRADEALTTLERGEQSLSDYLDYVIFRGLGRFRATLHPIHAGTVAAATSVLTLLKDLLQPAPTYSHDQHESRE